MSLPIIGFVPGWIVLVIALVLIGYFFGKRGLHVIAIVFLIWLAWYLFKAFF